MKNKTIEQFKGFLNTSPLWEGYGPFEMDQFILPNNPVPFPEENELINAIPALSRNKILGKRMESFFGYGIRRSSKYQIITENLQISRERITIGEIDFILKDKKKEVMIHVELVYKFYIYDPSFINEAEKWIGPNRRDSLLQKIKKLREQQFPLIFQEETKLALNSLNINNNELKQMVCFKANLFVPRGLLGKPIPSINNSCICGYWIYLAEFKTNEFKLNKFFIPNKTDWPVEPKVNKEWVSFSNIYEKVMALHENKFSPLIWMKTSSGQIERLFVLWW